MLEISSLTAGFDLQGGRINAVRDLSFFLAKGDTLGIAGESGCGKTITAYSIMRLLKNPGGIFSGSIKFNGTELTTLPERQMRKIRGKDIAMIFQEPSAALDPCFTAGEHIAETLREHTNLDAARIKSESIRLIESMKIPDCGKIYGKYPHELSGGMQQRILIASALACSPSLLIADEPTTALDVTVQSQILSLIRDRIDSDAMSLIFISHDLGITANLCRRCAIMYAGEIVEIGLSENVFSDPVHPYTQALLESLPSLNARKQRLKTIPGSIVSAGTKIEGCAFYDRCTSKTKDCASGKINLEQKKKEHFARCINR